VAGFIPKAARISAIAHCGARSGAAAKNNTLDGAADGAMGTLRSVRPARRVYVTPLITSPDEKV
jgi:hypothetical protein